VAAALAAINGNLTTKRQVIESRGDDADDVFEQRAEERRREGDLGINPVGGPGTKAMGGGADTANTDSADGAAAREGA